MHNLFQQNYLTSSALWWQTELELQQERVIWLEMKPLREYLGIFQNLYEVVLAIVLKRDMVLLDFVSFEPFVHVEAPVNNIFNAVDGQVHVVFEQCMVVDDWSFRLFNCLVDPLQAILTSIYRSDDIVNTALFLRNSLDFLLYVFFAPFDLAAFQDVKIITSMALRNLILSLTVDLPLPIASWVPSSSGSQLASVSFNQPNWQISALWLFSGSLDDVFQPVPPYHLVWYEDQGYDKAAGYHASF